MCSAVSKQHANFYNIICSEQHGFRKHRSCETQLLEAINYIIEQRSANRYFAFGLFQGFQQGVSFKIIIN